MSEAPRVAFKLGFGKRPVLNTNAASAVQFDSGTTTTANSNSIELVTGFDNGEIKSTAPKNVKQELVIPCQPNAHHRILKINKPTATATAPPSSLPTKTTTDSVNEIADEARRALLLDAQKANEAWSERTENGIARVHTIEQDASNTFMKDSTDKSDDETEKHAEDANYDEVPIEDFGMAAIRGMGYKEDTGLGISNKKTVDVFVPETRPRGLGLGADRKILEKINKLKRNLKQSGIDEKDDLCFEKGAFVLIQKGPHEDQYGTIEFIEEDTARLNVALAIGGTNRKKEVISISQYNVKLVTEKEFLKYSKYVNKSKAEKVEQETTNKLMRDFQQGSKHDDDDRRRDSKRHRSSRHDDDDRRHHRHSSSRKH